MDLQTAKKNFVNHGVMGGVLLVVGIASVFDGAFRRTTETIQEIWVVEFIAGLVLCLFGLVCLEVQFDTWSTWTGLQSILKEKRGTALRRTAEPLSASKNEKELIQRVWHGKPRRYSPGCSEVGYSVTVRVTPIKKAPLAPFYCISLSSVKGESPRRKPQRQLP